MAVEPFVDCSADLGNSERLRARATANGYLFFPGLLAATEVLALRRAVLEVAEKHQRLLPGSDPDAAIRREGVYASDTICLLPHRPDNASVSRRSTPTA